MEVSRKEIGSREMEGDDVSNREGLDEQEEDSTLWEQMTAREERDAARRAGMRAGDWQTERQLQEALRESRMDGNIGEVATAAEGESTLIDVGFHALATEMAEGEENLRRTTASAQKAQQTSASPPEAAAAAAAAGGSRHCGTACMAPPKGQQHKNTAGIGEGRASKHSPGSPEVLDKPREEEQADDDDEIDSVEFVVTQDGGVVPVVSAAVTTATAAVAMATMPEIRWRADHGGVDAVAMAAADRRGTARCCLSEGGDWGEGMVESVNQRLKRSTVAATSAVRAGGATSSVPGVVGGGDGGWKGVSDDRAPSFGKGHRRTARPDGDGGKEGIDGKGIEKSGEADDASGVGQASRVEGGVEDEEEEEELPPDIVLTLEDDVLHAIMLYLHPEDVVECRAVSSRWEFPLGEAVFEGLCRRTYLAQSAKKLLNVQRWRSWQNMFRSRPRLRTTGMYKLVTRYYKKPVRDMSTSWVSGQILECTYYRYFRFYGDGRVAYGLTHEPPKEFVRMLQDEHPKVMFGTYTMNKWEVNVEIPMPWAHVSFTLQLTNGERGHFTYLVLQRHSSISRNDLRAGRCHHSVKSSDVFTFRRVWQF